MTQRTIIFVNQFFYPDYSATSQFVSDLAFTLADEELDIHIITSRQRYMTPLPAYRRSRQYGM